MSGHSPLHKLLSGASLFEQSPLDAMFFAGTQVSKTINKPGYPLE